MNDIIQTNLNEEFEKSFITYAMAVNTDRAIPFATTGLKPVMRRILWDMYDTGVNSNKPHRKCAKIVGDTMGRWHPHGDSSIYEALVRLSQPWIMRYPLIDFHGNQGNVSGDGAASSRYTEARLAPIAEKGLLNNLKKRNVDFQPNYSEDEEEPVTLPSLFPNIFCNANRGIGDALACHTLPYNLTDIGNKILEYIKTGNVSFNNLYPDLPTGGDIISNLSTAQAICETGKGKIVIRGRWKESKLKGQRIIEFYEIPYEIIVEDVLKDVKNKMQDEKYKNIFSNILDVRDASDKTSGKIVFEINEGPTAESIVNILYAYTDMEESISANYTIIDREGNPLILNFVNLFDIYIQHNISCIKRECEFDLEKVQGRLEIVNGLLKALEDIDNIIALIKASESAAKAKEELKIKYKFTENQAQAIIKMTLGRLAGLERIELNEEKNDLVNEENRLTILINSEENLKQELYVRLESFVKEFGDERRTGVIEAAGIEKLSKSKIQIQKEPVVITVNKDTTINYTPAAQYSKPRTNSKAAKNMLYTLETQSTDNILLFTAGGKYYNIPAYKIQTNEIDLNGDRVVVIKNIPTNKQYYITMTKNGLVKKSLLKDISKVTKVTGSAACKIKDGDELVSVDFCNDNDFVLLVSSSGKGIKVLENEFALQGKATTGCKGITIKKGDCLEIGKCFTPKDKEYKYGRTTIKFSDYDYANKATIGLMMI